MEHSDGDTEKPLVERAPFNRGDTMAAISYGLPEMTEAEREKGASQMKKFVGVFMVGSPAIGFALALAIHALVPNHSYEKKLAIVQEYELQYLYLGAFLIVRTVMFVNLFPMIFKGRIMRGNSGNLRANMYIYKVAGPSSEPPKMVVLDDGGDVGSYNRANRSLTHMVENMPSALLALLLAGAMYPKAILGLCACFGAGRVMHAVGYTKGYGSHGAGFGLASLSAFAAEGLLLVTVFKGFGAF